MSRRSSLLIPSVVTVSRPEWQADEEAPQCNRCGKAFSLLLRRHHCRHCGLVFCGECCFTKLSLPEMGYEEEVLVCLPCVKRKNADVMTRLATPPDSSGVLPLAKKGEWERVFALLGREPYASDPALVRGIADFGWGLLHIAASQGAGDACRRLIQDFGIDKNCIDHSGQTPLAVACSANKLLCVCELLAHGCSVNIVDGAGRGALYNAASQGHLDVVQLLVEAKANAEQEDVDGVLPIEWARRFKRDAVVEFLTEQQGARRHEESESDEHKADPQAERGAQ